MKKDFEFVKDKIVTLNNEEKTKIIDELIKSIDLKQIKLNYILMLAELLARTLKIEIKKDVFFSLANIFENFTEENKKLVIRNLIMNIISLENKNTRDLKEKECLASGHDFSEWREVNYQTSSVSGETNGTYLKTINHRYWTRVCTRCYCYERTVENPFEKNTSKSEVLTKVKK